MWYVGGRMPTKPPQFQKINAFMGPRHPKKGLKLTRNSSTCCGQLSTMSDEEELVRYPLSTELPTMSDEK